MTGSQMTSLMVASLRFAAAILLLALSFLFIGWAILNSRTTGIVWVTLCSVIVLGMGTIGNISNRKQEDRRHV